MITIKTVTIHYKSQITECGCELIIPTPFGDSCISQNVAIPSAELSETWGDEELRTYVATSLGVPVNEVLVEVADVLPPAVPPVEEPPAVEPTPENP